MLTVSLTADTSETVTFHNALETLAFGDTRNVHPVAVGESIDSQSIAQIALSELFEFGELALRGYTRFLEVS